MKVIDLLNKIANGEEVPKEITVGRKVYKWNAMADFYEDENEAYKDLLMLCKITPTYQLVNTEVEIIEEDKPIKELDIIENEIDKQVSLKVGEHLNTMRKMDVVFATKINELVKEINKLKKG